jgi:outer membrane protein
LGLNLSIPIFSSFRNKYSVNNARIGYTAAQLNLQQQRNVLYKEIAQAHADAVGALKKFHATQKARDAFAETFTNADKKFNVGAANSLDYNTAKNNLSKSESDLLQAKYEFIFKTKILDFYKGIPIKL